MASLHDALFLREPVGTESTRTPGTDRTVPSPYSLVPSPGARGPPLDRSEGWGEASSREPASAKAVVLSGVVSHRGL